MRPQHSYSVTELRERCRDRPVHLIEAKRVLDRNVIGQVVAGRELFGEAFEPSELVSVAVVSDSNSDLASVCENPGIRTRCYPDARSSGSRDGPGRASDDGRTDVRNPPDNAGRTAFLRGWQDAVSGQLYGSVRTTKTHQNMVGNLFGWIYGDQPGPIRQATWKRYKSRLEAEADE